MGGKTWKAHVYDLYFECADLLECMAQWSADSWSPETDFYMSLVLLTVQIGF